MEKVKLSVLFAVFVFAAFVSHLLSFLIGYSKNTQCIFQSIQLDPASEVKEINKYNQAELDSLIKEALTFVMNLQTHERKIYSQNKEDGVLMAIFSQIGIKHKTFVEFDVEDGRQCNSRVFREKFGWKGLMMDGGYQNLAINLHREMIFPNNIVQLFRKYNVNQEIDLLSVGTDFKDFWLLQRILAAGYRPRVIISEYNSFLGPFDSKTVPLNWTENHIDKPASQYFGFSATAGWHLGRYYGYSMVYCELEGINCMWVIDGVRGFGPGIRISDYLNASSLWRPTCHLRDHRPDTRRRPWTTISANTKF